jgi:hypothetical protein
VSSRGPLFELVGSQLWCLVLKSPTRREFGSGSCYNARTRARSLPGSGFDFGRSRFWFIDKYVIFGVNVVRVFSKIRVAIVRVRRILELGVFSRRVVRRRVGRAPICYLITL